jgi:hypothetical protein
MATIGCEKKDSETFQLEGQWMRQDVKTDTITFKQFEKTTFFDLKRGNDTIGNQIIPKTPCGLFEYKIYGDSIWVQWAAASSLSDKKYYFKKLGSTIEMGNFIDKSNTIITFQYIGQ